MSGPIYSLIYVHNAIVAELRTLDGRASTAENAAGIGALADDLEFFRDLMYLHHQGEETAVFPLLDKEAPGYAATYLFDHKAEKAQLESLCSQARAAQSSGELDIPMFQSVLTAMVHAGLTHIEKENTLVIPELAARFSPAEQGEIVSNVISPIPKDKMPRVVPWIIARQSADDAAAYVRGLMAGMPAPVFAAAKGWIRSGIDEARWVDLSQRVPELAS